VAAVASALLELANPSSMDFLHDVVFLVSLRVCLSFEFFDCELSWSSVAVPFSVGLVALGGVGLPRGLGKPAVVRLARQPK